MREKIFPMCIFILNLEIRKFDNRISKRRDTHRTFIMKLEVDFRPLVQSLPSNICSLLFSLQSVLKSVTSFEAKVC